MSVRSMMTGTLLTTVLSSGVAAADPVIAPYCGEYLPMITEGWRGAPHRQVHFVPKRCNQILVNGKLETIPPAVSVISGGINTELSNTCIDKQCGVPLKPNMLYRTYVFKDETTNELKINFSVTGHKEDPTYGNEVNADDPAQSFIGLTATDERGLACGGGNLCLLSWFHRGHVGLGRFLGAQVGNPIADVCSQGLTPVPNASVKILTFGINNLFTQGYNVPNVYASGTIGNTATGKTTEAAIGIEWGGTIVSFIDGAPGRVRWPHYAKSNIVPGMAVSFSTDGVLPAPLVAGTTYYVKGTADRDSFTISASPPQDANATELAFSGASGKHIINIGLRRGGPLTTFYKQADDAAGSFHAVAFGALGAEEGWIKATLMLGAPNGGCARLPEGAIYTSPHHS